MRTRYLREPLTALHQQAAKLCQYCDQPRRKHTSLAMCQQHWERYHQNRRRQLKLAATRKANNNENRKGTR